MNYEMPLIVDACNSSPARKCLKCQYLISVYERHHNSCTKLHGIEHHGQVPWHSSLLVINEAFSSPTLIKYGLKIEK